jgi:branched-chain amino acid aminotransferase
VKVYFNGALVAATEARIDPADRGFTLGDGLFETIAVKGGAPRRLAAHLARLERGARVLDLALPWSMSDLGLAVAQTIVANELQEGVLRLTVTRGPAPRGLLPPAVSHPTLVIAPAPWPEAPAPARAVIAAETRRNERSPLSRIKCLGSLDNVLARQEAAKRGADDALLLNSLGRVAEATASNVFLVLDGRLVTPPIDDGALPGVVRADVIARLSAVERSLTAEDAHRASEAFLTNSLGVRALVAIDGWPVGSGAPGPAFARARAIAEG